MKDTNLDFDGMSGTGVNRAGNRFAGNQHTGKHIDATERNFGMGPRVGNESCSGNERGVGPSVTKDPHAKTIATAKQGGRINGGATVKGFANPDAINVGMK